MTRSKSSMERMCILLRMEGELTIGLSESSTATDIVVPRLPWKRTL